ncbi:DUF3800 domain-containing protein [Parerythrobacter lacustris]|uniref:DUF3800 domain-containing protein n=1 Tax=Parerythrobacter lacustris TaxID=2969984 RepID=A0ABT1XRG7_9SPHN|nr:DUF3800 domain-containing protein [Parerythrobacter lacustris]MCR2833012.1 DUF3800 domain-containing protein [Parerythrobacter lacustris]
MFIDDTGDVSNSTTNLPQNRFASITGVIFERDYLFSTFEPGFRKLVGRHFGDENLVLHRRKMVKPPKQGPFSVLHDQTKRDAWDRGCLDMMTRAAYTVITVSLDKVAYYYHHPKAKLDVYETLIQNSLERYFYFLRHRGIGDVIVEAQNPGTDQAIAERYRDVYDNGTEHISADKIQSVLSSREINIESKSKGYPGLQFADLMARPSFAHCRAVYMKDTSDLTAFARNIAPILEDYKFYRDKDGNPDRYGRVWRPPLKKLNGP